MSFPKVSVLIPSYNHEKYIKESIESVINQTFQDFEIIITDDGSSDRTVDVIREFEDERISLFVFEENKGAPIALNNCILKAKGKYISYISSDDIWELNKLEKQVKFMDENLDIGLVFTKVNLIDENSELCLDNDRNNSTYSNYKNVFDKENRTKEEWLKRFFFKGNCICHPSIMIRKEIYDDVGLYDKSLANLPDFDMWVRVCLKYNIYIMDDKLTRFRIRGNEKNISAPTSETHKRIKFEQKQIFNHYLNIKDTETFLKVFPDSKKYGKLRKKLIPYFLGRIACDMEIDNRELWGLEIIHDLMKSEDIAELLKDYDFTFAKFIKFTSNKDPFHIEDVSRLRKAVPHISKLNNDIKERNVKLKTKNTLIKNKDKKIKSQKNELKNKNKVIKTYNSSMSWKITKPLRKIGHFFRKFKNNPYLFIILKRNMHFKKLLTDIRGYKRIKDLNLFNKNYYIKKYSLNSNINPFIHYMYYGAKEGKNPSKNFNSKYYLKKYPTVNTSKMNPLVHYALFGKNEGKSPNITPKSKKNIKKELIEKNYLSLKSYNINHHPMVSIIILNRNGIKHLKRLFKDFQKNTGYNNYELIVVDNNSSDGSIKFLKDLPTDLNLKIIKNEYNKTFSEANNQGASEANGKYLLLLNNDIEPTHAWLNEMMGIILNNNNIGSVGAKLVYPKYSNPIDKSKSFKIQHAGTYFKNEGDNFRAYNHGNGLDPFDSSIETKKVPGVTAAALLIRKSVYDEVGGLDEKYVYGYEDVDLALKLLKLGYKNVLCSTALLFHHESSTQKKDPDKTLSKRRKNNFKILNKKWGSYLFENILNERLNRENFFTEESLKIGIIVTEMGPESKSGDAFTALELAKELKLLGYEIKFINKKDKSSQIDLDIIINLLYNYDISKLKIPRNTIKIAWMRSWFDKWVANPEINDYDLYLASSKTACNYVNKYLNKEIFEFPIATNSNRFNSKNTKIKKYESDYCFTGSYWGASREIIDLLNPDTLDYKFSIYGANWNKIDKFKNNNKGFINYLDIPKLYSSTKIVIDDANHVTEPYGAVNSRVFDAVASGTLVLTNGLIGAKETFKGILPHFKSKEELNELITFYLENDGERLNKIEELRQFVLTNHTYKHRALKLKELIESQISKKSEFFKNPTISIKTPVPNKKVAPNWGDYHFALALKKEFETKNHKTDVHFLNEWNKKDNSDVILVLRGLSEYNPNPEQYNIMWNISHPELVSIEEYNRYNHVFIASNIYSNEINEKTKVNVTPLLQCTDNNLFFNEFSEEYEHELLFVGNSRDVYRKIIKDLLPTKRELGLYGKSWEQLIPEKYITGEYIDNKELHKAYSSCKILLNDHWKEMADKGFISNRIFDGFASGAFIISDEINGVEEIFPNTLVTYSNKEELHDLIEYYIENDNERKEKAKLGSNNVLNYHTFEKRAEEILSIIKNKDL